MNGFYLAIGKQGSGKTAFITKLLTDQYKTGMNVFSNYTLLDMTYEKIGANCYKHITLDILLNMLDRDTNSLNDSIILLDEIHIYLDSLDFMRSNNRRLQTFFSQLRKRNILLFATTQYIMNVDIRIRRQCMNVFEMEHIYKDLFKVITHDIDGYFTKELNEFHINLSDYYSKYNTNEVITE